MELYACKIGDRYVSAILNDEVFTGISRNSGKMALIRLIRDNKTLAQQLEKKKKFNMKTIEEYITNYNLQKKYDSK